MTSVLSAKRDDLELDSISLEEHGQDTLWNKLHRSRFEHSFLRLLKTISADVALWPGVSNERQVVWDGCVYAAYIVIRRTVEVEKTPDAQSMAVAFHNPQRKPPMLQRKEASFARKAKDTVYIRVGLDTRGTALRAPAFIGDLFAQPAVYTSDMLAVIQQNVQRYIRAGEYDVNDTLLKYGAAYHRFESHSYDSDTRVNMYLFHGWLRIFEDTSDFDPMENFEGRTIRELYAIRLTNIKQLMPTLRDDQKFLISIDYLNLGGTRSSITLILSELQNAIGWYMMLARHVYRCKHRKEPKLLDMRHVEDSAILPDFLLAMNAWKWFHFRLWRMTDDIGQLVYHARVENTTHVRSTFLACVFPKNLFFLSQTPQGDRVLHSSVDLDKVVSLHDRSYKYRWGSQQVLSIITGLTQPMDSGGLVERKEFTFEVGDKESAGAAWKNAINEVIPDMHFEDLTSQETLASAKTATVITEPSTTSSRLPEFEESFETTNSSEAETETRTERSTAGILLLCTSVGGNQDEFNVIVGVIKEFKSQGIATWAVSHALGRAFDHYRAHRVQARILHPSLWTAGAERIQSAEAARAIGKFVHLGFTHEGVRRRVVQHPKTGIWQDMTVLAMLDSEWLVRDSRAPPPKLTLWDDLFARHQREHEALKRMEGSGQLKRTRSMETVRDLRSMRDAAPTPSIADARSSALDSFSSQPPSTSASELGSLSSWDSVSETSDLKSLNNGIETVHINKTAAAVAAAAADDAADEYASWDDIDEGEDEMDCSSDES